MEGRKEGTRRHRGREYLNQDILCEKNSVFNKKEKHDADNNILKWSELLKILLGFHFLLYIYIYDFVLIVLDNQLEGSLLGEAYSHISHNNNNKKRELSI